MIVRQRHAALYGLRNESINAELVNGGGAGRDGGRLGRLRVSASVKAVETPRSSWKPGSTSTLSCDLA